MISPEALMEVPVSPATVRDVLIPFYADFYGVPSTTMAAVVGCESSFFSGSIGDHGHARGLAQINDLYHPEVKTYQALNPSFALNFLASQLAKGQGRQWTCYRKYFGADTG